MNGKGTYFLVKFCNLDDSGVKALEEMLSEKTDFRRNQSVDWGVFSSRAILYEVNREQASVTLMLFDFSGRMNLPSAAELHDEISDGFNRLFEVEVAVISSEELARERPDAAKKMLDDLALCRMRYDDACTAITLKGTEQIMEEAASVGGWGCFSDSLARISRRIDNDVSGRTNLNVAFVAETNDCVEDYVRFLYDFYFARGVVTAPYIYRGDLSDAAASQHGGVFMYVIADDFEGDGGGFIVAGRRDSDDCLRLLRASKNILVAGLTEKSYEAVAGNPLFECVFPTVVRIAEPTAEEKLAFIKKEAAAYNFKLSSKVAPGTLNGVAFEKLRAKLVKAISSRLEEEDCSYTLSAEDFAENTEAPDDTLPFVELDSLIGLESVKKAVREIAAFVERRGNAGGLCLHMVFRGRPGTGKTTVARIIGKIFGSIGVIKNAERFVEADRNALVSKYLGGTAARTSSVVEAALGGVLFIDEAYALCGDREHDYGQEAVATLVKLMEDHRKEFVCILAGYPEEMDGMLDMNPGMRGRVQFYIDFPDYSVPEMMEIFASMCCAEGYVVSEGAAAALEAFFEKLRCEEDFANGRTVRRVFEQIRIKQAVRSELMDIEEEDVRAAADSMPLRSAASPRGRTIGFQGVV